MYQDNSLVGYYSRTVDYNITSTYNYELMNGSSKVDPNKDVVIEFSVDIDADSSATSSVGDVTGTLYSGTIDTSPIIEDNIEVEVTKINSNTFTLYCQTTVTWEQLGLGYNSDPDNYSNDLAFEFLFF